MATVDLCLIADVRTQAEIPTTTTTSDALIQTFITAASREIGRRYEREFISEASGSTARRFRVGGSLVALTPYDLRAVPTSVVLHPESPSPTTLTVDVDYTFITGARTLGWRIRLARELNLSTGFSTSFGFAQLEVTGTAAAHWGVFANTAAVTDDVRRACVLTVASWLQRDIGSLGIQGIDDDRGIRPSPSVGWPIPSAAHFTLKPYEPVKVH